MTTNARQRIGAATLAIVACAALPGPATAQTVSDEARCVMLSNAFASNAKDPRHQQVAAATGAYFLGRLDVRPPDQVKAALASLRKSAGRVDASSLMNACVARAGRAEAQLRALAK